MAEQRQKQKQVSSQQSVKIRILKSQINSTFKTFTRILKYAKSGNVDQNMMISYNDTAVATLDLFGANCEMYARENRKNVLVAGWAYFDSKRKSMDKSDRKMIGQWLNYMDCALVGKQLPALQITQQSVQRGRQNVLSGMANIVSKIIGAQHKTGQMIDDARANSERHMQQDQVLIQNAQPAYAQVRMTAQAPTQEHMYAFCGGTQNMVFSSGLTSKTFQKGRRSDQKDPENDGDSVMQGMSQLNMKPKGNNAPNQMIRNAFITKDGPGRKIYDPNRKELIIKYPFPCEIVKQVGQFEFMVRFAGKHRNIGVKLNINCLERDPIKVEQIEECFISQIGPLGYPSIQEKDAPIQWNL